MDADSLVDALREAVGALRGIERQLGRTDEMLTLRQARVYAGNHAKAAEDVLAAYAAQSCCCGDSALAGIVHRAGGPCYVRQSVRAGVDGDGCTNQQLTARIRELHDMVMRGAAEMQKWPRIHK